MRRGGWKSEKKESVARKGPLNWRQLLDSRYSGVAHLSILASPS
jgi:hypothetical protein